MAGGGDVLLEGLALGNMSAFTSSAPPARLTSPVTKTGNVTRQQTAARKMPASLANRAGWYSKAGVVAISVIVWSTVCTV